VFNAVYLKYEDETAWEISSNEESAFSYLSIFNALFFYKTFVCMWLVCVCIYIYA